MVTAAQRVGITIPAELDFHNPAGAVDRSAVARNVKTLLTNSGGAGSHRGGSPAAGSVGPSDVAPEADLPPWRDAGGLGVPSATVPPPLFPEFGSPVDEVKARLDELMGQAVGSIVQRQAEIERLRNSSPPSERVNAGMLEAFGAGRTILEVSVGSGKSHALRKHLLKSGVLARFRFLVAVPTHKLADELAACFAADAAKLGIDPPHVTVLRGLTYVKRDAAGKVIERACNAPKERRQLVRAVSKSGGSPRTTVCPGCPLRETCKVFNQYASGPGIVILTHAALAKGVLGGVMDDCGPPVIGLAIDESFWATFAGEPLVGDISDLDPARPFALPVDGDAAKLKAKAKKARKIKAKGKRARAIEASVVPPWQRDTVEAVEVAEVSDDGLATFNARGAEQNDELQQIQARADSAFRDLQASGLEHPTMQWASRHGYDRITGRVVDMASMDDHVVKEGERVTLCAAVV